MGLVTGNAERIAKLKLKKVGLFNFFSGIGGFGDSSMTRRELALEAIRKAGDFDFIVFVSIRNNQPKFYVLTKGEFMELSGQFGWRSSKGTRVLGIVEKTTGKELKNVRAKQYINYCGSKNVVDSIGESEDKWVKIQKAVS